jgi:hypothetical protein
MAHADDRIDEAMDIIERFGGTDGAHHKQWCLDQVARALMADRYEQWVKDVKAGADGPETYGWDEGIAP